MSKIFTRERAKQAGVAVAVIAAICIVAAGLSFVFYPKNNTKEAGMYEADAFGFMGEPKETLDVLFVGDSRVFSSFSPLQMYSEYGFTSYDAASSGQQLPLSTTMLKRAFKTQRPKVVVIETDSFFLEYPIGDVILTELAYNVPFLEFHSRWKNLTWADFTQAPRATYTDPLKGFRINTGTDAAKADDFDEDEDKNLVQELPNNVEESLGKVVELCRSYGATPILVSAPSTKKVDSAHHNALQLLANVYDLDYLDLNDVEGLDIDWNTDTSDEGEHLNYNGAKKTSDFLGAYLQEHYGLPDHRQDAAYDFWDDYYAAYATQIPAE